MPIPDMLLLFIFIIAATLFFLAIAFISFAVKIVPENKRVVIMRLGKVLGSRGPGIVIVLPIIDFAIWVELNKTYRLKYSNLPTRDQREMSCMVVLDTKVTDPGKSVLNVPNLEIALAKVVETGIKDLIANKNSAELIQRRDWLEEQLKDVLQRSGRSWGVDITRLAIEEIQDQ